MEKFKYIVVANGSLAARKRLVKELYKIGYKKENNEWLCLKDTSASNYCITMNYKCGINYHTPHSGILDGFSNEGEYWKRQGVKYQFEIDNESEFQSALAIAAIRDDDEFYPGELFINMDGPRSSPEMHRVLKVSQFDMQADVDFNPKSNRNQNYYTKRNRNSSSGFYWSEKATPEEIIEYFKNNKSININKKKMNEKKIIGYKLIRPEYREAVKIIGDFTNIETFENYELTAFVKDYKIVKNKLIDAKVLDLWFKPIYEQDEVTIGGYKAIKEGDLVAFGCQKFDIAELYAYKKLLQGHKENKAEITVMGTKISVEILDRLIEML